ncbi:hypothetical protein NTH_03583 [Nitratireductor thuwali]|uniref:Uncharacterized protein n=1 Tax=Nitratireductor thuwali TaxID=2267699 RepID=A0ABY5MR49_9HYPH|nr:hypothetical protein NTH_03583 [Nitratireductor thuwali]
MVMEGAVTIARHEAMTYRAHKWRPRGLDEQKAIAAMGGQQEE